MKIAIVGAGGLGSYIGGVLAEAGHEVTLVARGEHLEAIRTRGLEVRSHAGDFTTHPKSVESAHEIEGADLAFLATKTFSVDEVAPSLLHLAEQGTTVVSLLNGVTAVERLVAAGLAEERVADGIAYMTSFRIAPGVVERKAAHQRIVVADASPAFARLKAAFADTLVDVESVPDIRVELWQKMAVVCALSVLCAIGEWNMGSVRGHAYGAGLQKAAIAEVVNVGRACGVAIPVGAESEIDVRLDRFPDDFFPSVIHDLRSSRPTEMADLGGEIVRLGRAHGVPVPLHEAGTLIVQLEERSYA